MNIDFASITDRGPRSTNEDKVDFWRLSGGVFVAAVADGLGGMGKGDVASHLAVKSVKSFLEKYDGSIDESTLVNAGLEAHNQILAEQKKDLNQNKMATTLSIVLINEHSLLGLHCGDSRIALARGQGIKKLTSEHSEGARLFKSGKLTKEEYLNYARKNILESAIGAEAPPVLDTFNFDIQSGDVVVLTTDGAHELVKLRELRSVISEYTEAQSFIDAMGELIQNRQPKDNFTIFAAYFS